MHKKYLIQGGHYFWKSWKCHGIFVSQKIHGKGFFHEISWKTYGTFFISTVFMLLALAIHIKLIC